MARPRESHPEWRFVWMPAGSVAGVQTGRRIASNGAGGGGRM
jgi:hypothetical protein